MMNSEDISKYYFCFTQNGFKGDGTFYRYLQKSLTKTIKTFDTGNIRHMFIEFNNDQNRLNSGIKGRIKDQLFDLMDKRKMKGYDVQYIYE